MSLIKKNIMNKILKIIATLLIILVVIFSCNKIISNNLEEDINNSPAMESFGAKMEIKNIAEIMSKQLPQSVDENTKAIKIEYLQNDNLLVFYYEVKNVTKEDIENKKIEAIKVQNISQEKIAKEANKLKEKEMANKLAVERLKIKAKPKPSKK